MAVAGFVITMLSGDHDAGLSALDRALALNPSCATSMYLGSVTNAFSGHPNVAVALADRAQTLSPFDFLTYQAHLARGTAAIQERRYKEAASHYRKAVEANASLSSLYFCAAAAFALAQDRDAAQSFVVKAGLEREPSFRFRLFSELMSPEVADRLAEGCRLLDLPE